MRITQGMMQDRLLGDLRTSQTRIAQLQRQGQTQTSINTPSDDALGAATALRTKDDLGRLKGYQDNAADATGWVTSADTALQHITDLIHRAHELGVNGASDTTNAAGRAAMAKELGAIIDSVKDSANARYGDSYVFSGHDTTTPPYTQGATDTYAGDSGVIARTIGPGQSVQVNATGNTFLGSGGGDGKLLDVLRTLQTNLTSGNTAGMGTDLKNLDAQLDAVGSVRATLGATQNRVDAANESALDATDTATKLLDDVSGVDLAEVLTQLSLQQTAYTAALKTGASVIQTSLLDFLR